MYTWLPIATAVDFETLDQHVGAEFDPVRVGQRLSDSVSDAVKGVLIERNYIDKDYRSTYYNFYAKKGQHYPLNCVRLHFFDSTVSFDVATLKLSSMLEVGAAADVQLTNHYFGYMVLRPTRISTIGRTVLSPDVRRHARGRTIAGWHKVHLLGYKLEVHGFPSMDQHADISVCAHAACWSILRHYSERYHIYREFLTHDITVMAHEFNPGGLVPSKGLEMAHAERVFQAAGTFPIYIARNEPEETCDKDDDKEAGDSEPAQKASALVSDPSFYRQLCAYVESGFPLFAAMHVHGHAIAVVGYNWRTAAPAGSGLRYAWDELQSLCVVDDNHPPYMSVPVDPAGIGNYCAPDIDSFIVALPEKVFYPADAVDRLAPTLFRLGTLVGLPPQDKTIIRYFITTGSSLRTFSRQHASELDPRLLEIIMTLPFAQFVWVVEFATREQWAVGQVEARAVIDATASFHEIMPLWLMHGRQEALVFDRQSAEANPDGMGVLKLKNMNHAGYSRMEANTRPIVAK
jgi:hypothetical protein